MIGYRHLAGMAMGMGVFLLSACGAVPAHADRHPAAVPVMRLAAAVKTGTLHGTFVAEGGPAPGRAFPSSGTVKVLSGSHLVVIVRASDGTFTVRLPPGSYTLTGSHNGTPCQSAHVVITAAGSARAQVVCDVP